MKFPTRRTVALGSAGVLTATAITAGVWFGAASASPAPSTVDRVVQQQLDGLVDLGFPAALASVTHPDGSHDDYVAGVGDLATGSAVPVDGEVRAGSNTKTFTAVVVLQLAEEGLIRLDEPIETFLPGLVHGAGIDGAAITVRQLLQHTSGLPDYTTGIATDLEAIQHAYRSPRDLLDLALAQPARFAPGTSWEYSNTNYLLLGILIERLTQRPVGEVITDRIIEPLDLTHTYFPAVGEQELRGDHPHGYHRGADGELADVSELDPSFGWAAGQLVTTPSELNEFFRAVLDGRLVSDATLDEMQTTVPADQGLWVGSEYGLGIESYPLSCGGVIWGHGGDIQGYQTRDGVTADGTGFTVAVTALPWGIIDPSDEDRVMDAYRAVTTAVDEVLCAE